MANVPDSALPRPDLRVVDSVWLDLNSRLGLSAKPDLLPDISAINNSLFNLFSCPIGARGPIFEPEYGTVLHRLLHDPLDGYTANKIRANLIQAIQRWEPRIELDIANTVILPDFDIPGYRVKTAYTILASGTYGQGTFNLSIAQGGYL